MRLIILAAGRHKRLPGLEVPKALIEFEGTTITEMVIKGFVAAGVTEVGICVGYQADKIVDRIGDVCHGAKVVYFNCPKYETTGAAASLLEAKSFYLDHDCVVMEGDHLLHPWLPGKLLDIAHHSGMLVDDSAPLDYGEETAVVGFRGVVRSLYWPASTVPDKFRHSNRDRSHAVGEAIVMVKLSARMMGFVHKRLGSEEIIDPLSRTFRILPCAYRSTEGLPWIEIDTPADLERARDLYHSMKEE